MDLLRGVDLHHRSFQVGSTTRSGLPGIELVLSSQGKGFIPVRGSDVSDPGLRKLSRDDSHDVTRSNRGDQDLKISSVGKTLSQ